MHSIIEDIWGGGRMTISTNKKKMQIENTRIIETELF